MVKRCPKGKRRATTGKKVCRKFKKYEVKGRKNGKPFKKIIKTTLGVVALGQGIRVTQALGGAVVTQIKKVK